MRDEPVRERFFEDFDAGVQVLLEWRGDELVRVSFGREVDEWIIITAFVREDSFTWRPDPSASALTWERVRPSSRDAPTERQKRAGNPDAFLRGGAESYLHRLVSDGLAQADVVGDPWREQVVQRWGLHRLRSARGRGRIFDSAEDTPRLGEDRWDYRERLGVSAEDAADTVRKRRARDAEQSLESATGDDQDADQVPRNR